MQSNINSISYIFVFILGIFTYLDRFSWVFAPPLPSHWYTWVSWKDISFNISKFEESQVVLMLELDKRNKDLCRVWIYSVKNNEYVILRFSEIRNNKNEKWWIKLFWKNKYETNEIE